MVPFSPSSSCFSTPPISTIHRLSGWAGRACILNGCRQSWIWEKFKALHQYQLTVDWMSCPGRECMLGSCTYTNICIHTEGSREMMRTVLSTSPTARNRERCSPGGTLARLIQTTSADISFRSVYSFSWPDLRDKEGVSITIQIFSWKNALAKYSRHWHRYICSYRVHFKVDQLPSREGDNHLPLVHSTADNCLFARSLPLIHTFVCSDVSDTIWVNLVGEEIEKQWWIGSVSILTQKICAI